MRFVWVVAAAACVGGGSGKTTGDSGPADSGSILDSGPGDTGYTTPVTIDLSGQGFACLYGEGGVVDLGYGGYTEFVADHPTEVQVVLSTCVSGCAYDLEATCEATLYGATIEVTASGSYRVPSGDVTCPSSCGYLRATCAGPTLPYGGYVVDYATGQAPVAVPSTGPVPCAGR